MKAATQSKKNKMKQQITTKKIVGLLIISLILLATNIFSQTTTKSTGYFCTGANELSPFKYTREYKKENDGAFVTLYKIYSPTEGYYLNIKATHYKFEKKIVVSIDDITVSKEFGHISAQEIIYEEPSLKMFGRANVFRAAGMDEQGRLPNDLGLKFADSKFQYIKVVNIVRDNQMNSAKWYVLDEKI